MSKGDWIKPVAFGLVVLATVLIWASFYLGSQLGEARGQRNYSSASYERHAQEEISRACLRRDGVDLAECIAEIINTTNEQQRAESDLVAQTEMATWAFWMLMATIVIAAITGVGVVFVWQTLGATRAMASETTRIGEAQVRAYLSIESCTVGFDASTHTLGLTFEVRNTGTSPAKFVKLKLVAYFDLFEGKIMQMRDVISSRDISGNTVELVGKKFADPRDVERLSEYIGKEGILFTLSVTAEAVDVFNKPTMVERKFAIHDIPIGPEINGLKMDSLDRLQDYKDENAG